MADIASITRETRLTLDAARSFATEVGAMAPGSSIPEVQRTRGVIVTNNTGRLLEELGALRMRTGTGNPALNTQFSNLQGMLYRAQQLIRTRPGSVQVRPPGAPPMSQRGQHRDTIPGPAPAPRGPSRNMRPVAPNWVPGRPASSRRRQSESFYESLSELDGEADSMSGGQDKRSRRNRQEAIRVDRMRTDRAMQRSQTKAELLNLRRQARRRVRAKAIAMTPRAVQQALTVLPPAIRSQPAALGALTAVLNSTLIQTFGTLMAEAGDGGGDLSATVMNAAIAAAVATAVQRVGLTGQIDPILLARVLYQIYGSTLSPELKVLATPLAVIAMSRKPKGSREVEAFAYL